MNESAVAGDAPMDFERFMEDAWNGHGDRPRDVADRIAASLSLVDDAQRIAPLARLVVHVFGEHLGDWQGGIDVLDALRRLPACATHPLAGVSTAQGAAGDDAASGRSRDLALRFLSALADDDRAWCEAERRALGA